MGDACSNYSHIWRHPEGLYVTIEHKGYIRDVLRTWAGGPSSRIAVVTDGASELYARFFCVQERLFTGSRILGLGDLGANGLPISIGKLYGILFSSSSPNADLEFFQGSLCCRSWNKTDVYLAHLP